MTNPAAVKEAVKETKAQRVERLKRTKNPWEGLEEIRSFARQGFESIPPEWIGTYFRWWGVYTQGDGAGVTGGKNGEGKALPCFMVRIRIPNGQLRSQQLRTIADLTDRYAKGVADITVRQISSCTGSRSKHFRNCWRNFGKLISTPPAPAVTLPAT